VCRQALKAEPPEGLEPGSRRANLRAFVIYLRSVQGIPLARLAHVLRDLFAWTLAKARWSTSSTPAESLFMQTSLIKARLLAGTRWPRTKPG